MRGRMRHCYKAEKAFLKQPKVFLSSKKSGKAKRPGKGGSHYWKNIGLNFKTPRERHYGHKLCSTCKTRVQDRCPTCRQELGDGKAPLEASGIAIGS
nr:40s ribosomal protein s11-3 [Quercus suber]